MNFVIVQQHFANTRSFGIVGTLTCVERTDSFHFISGQFKVKNVDVAFDTLRIRGLRQNDKALLHLKSQKDLTCVLAVISHG